MTGRPLRGHHPNCYGCGPENPGSLGLQFYVDGERIRSSLRMDERHEGAPGFAHGGAVAAALDDTLGTLLVVLRRPAVTAKLEVNFRKPAFLGADFEIEAWTDRVEGRKLHLAANMCDADGEIVADAVALFLEVDIAHFARGGKDMPDEVKRHWARDRPELPY
jgi:acyl-coenzyme A thioesterase PaaI-like protein